MKSKIPTLDGEPVKILRPLQIKVSQAGKADKFIDLVDKEGAWVVIEYLIGIYKGNRKPIVLEKLKTTL